MTGYIDRARLIWQENGARGLAWKSVDHFLLQGTILRFLGWYYRRTEAPSGELPTICRVDSSDIAYQSDFTQRQFPVTDSKLPGVDSLSGVYGGPWDRFRSSLTDSPIYQAIAERFRDGVAWEETEHYRRTARAIDAGGSRWNSSSERELREKIQFLERLYESMAQHGYVPQTEVENYSSDALPKPEPSTKRILGDDVPNECMVGVGRNGEMIRFTGAHHRVSIAKVLDLSDIPVVVTVRHERWQQIREAYQQASSVDAIPDELLEFASHPDIPHPSSSGQPS